MVAAAAQRIAGAAVCVAAAARGRVGAARQCARPSLAGRPDRGHGNRDRPKHPDRADRRVDLRLFAAQECSRVGQQGRVPHRARHHARLGAGRVDRQPAAHRPGRGGACDAVAIARAETDRAHRAVTARFRHPHRPARYPQVRTWSGGDRNPARRRTERIGRHPARPGAGPARRCGARGGSAQADDRCRARPRSLRHRCARNFARRRTAARFVRIEAPARAGGKGRRSLVALARHGGDEPVGPPGRAARAGGGFGALSPVGQDGPGTIPERPAAAPDQSADRRGRHGHAQGPAGRWRGPAIDAIAARRGTRRDRPWRQSLSQCPPGRRSAPAGDLVPEHERA